MVFDVVAFGFKSASKTTASLLIAETVQTEQGRIKLMSFRHPQKASNWFEVARYCDLTRVFNFEE